MTFLANAFLWSFALEAVAAACDAVARAAFGIDSLAIPRLSLGLATFALSLPVTVAIGLGPRLPKSILLPPLAFVYWGIVANFPVGLWIESSLVRMGAAAAAQVVLGVWALRRVRHRSARGRWLLDNDVSRGPTFQPGHALRALGVGILFGLPGLALFSCLVFGTWIESATARFVTFDANGIHASAREYRRGDRTVHLVGMMHIGEGDAYREIFESFTGESTIVLEEGVTDDQALLGEGGFYDRVAGSLGLDVQPPFAAITSEQPASATGAPWPDVRRADIDASQFTPETIAFLAALSKVYQSPDLTTALRRFESSLGDIDVQTTNGVIHDLITRRNAHLIEVLREALETHERVVVPWGALHLREIEQTLLEWDFVHQASTQRRLTRYLTIARALTTEAEPLDPLRDD